jgi:hypothetical protein
MDFNATIDLIIRDLDEAREIIDDLKRYPGVPVLQVELAKSKCKTAGEVIALLKTIRDTGIPDATAIPVVKTIPEIKIIPTAEVEFKKEPTDEPERHLSNQDEPAILADTFHHLSGSLNEQLGGRKTEADISDLLKTKPLINLTDAIGINDRFLFIREIFNNNKDAYSQAISRLDSAESLKDARIIMSFTGVSNDNEAVKQLLDLVKRKLPSDE